jgi:predicted nucleotidyltransferase
MRTLSLSDAARETGLREQILQALVASPCKHVTPERVILFGSRTQQRFEQMSDIDVAVDCREEFIPTDLIDEETPTLLDIDIVSLRFVSERLRNEVSKEGIVLYEK